MLDVVGEVFPFALVVAISPPPIIAVVLMLLAPNAARLSLAYLAGWIVGIVVLISAFSALASIIPERDPNEAQPIIGVIQLLLGGGLLYLALRTWQKRPAPGEDAAMPSWMAAIDSITPARALGRGFLLSARNPKNLIMVAPSGLVIASAGLDAGSTTVAIVVFTVLASLSVLIPVVAYRVAPAAVVRPLQVAHAWLVQNNATVMAIVIFVLGVNAIGNGLGKFA
ncbi:MAG: GAP family protein [Thermomicrobiales bacterium]